MTVAPSIDRDRFLEEHLSQAFPDLPTPTRSAAPRTASSQELKAPTDGYSSGYVDNDALAWALDANPNNHYLNVHNADYPAGAVRGLLH